MKRIVIGVFLFFGILVGANFALEYWLEYKVRQLLNADEERKYDLLFDDIAIDLLGRKIALNAIRLVPLQADLGIRVNGSIHQIQLLDVRYWDLLLHNQVSIGELSLVEPSFRLVRQDSTAGGRDNTQAFQNLFGDLIQRGRIEDFKLSGGTGELFFGRDTLFRFGQFTDLNIHALGLKTDSLILTHPVPFEVDQITSSLKNFKLNLTKEQTFSMDSMSFDYNSKLLLMEGLSLSYTLPMLEMALKESYQQDFISFDLRRFQVEQLDASSNLYGDWSIIAGLAKLEGLDLYDYRNKNLPRKYQDAKPMFAKMLQSLPLPLKIDEVRIEDSRIRYAEVPEGDQEPGVLIFDRFKADISNLVSIDSLQLEGAMRMSVETEFMEKGLVKADFTIPFDQEYFDLDLEMNDFQLIHLNPVLERLAHMRIRSGLLHHLKLEMRGNPRSATNKFVFDYSDLKVEVLNPDRQNQKSGILTVLAGFAVSKENIPQEKRYRIGQFSSVRNPYRGPFNFMWENTKTGLGEIVPVGAAKLFTN